jgi:3D (Asp-Asp-Asp) domain-containing protein
MKKMLVLSLLALAVASLFPTSCLAVGTAPPKGKTAAKATSSGKTRTAGKGKAFTATLTTYWSQGGGSDYWSKKGIGATGERLKAGVTVAADPRVLPYGTVIEISGIGRRVVQDTGSHVVQRVASRKRGVNYPVIDLFFENRSAALRFANRSEPFAEIRVIKRGMPRL